ncbi:penicillin-binding transpeptidase domain-containing protein [Nocardiopsis ansamitocini]|uniref:Penicillin-binding protein n=1 Tax=Nocardiopsis ansamitocini TaxID=1670832 RepID=A0A9W6P2D7_9ACTN|nr:penicillin-binding transpeptidase domain-containing protein [Nocardiopsis ansamitocini]GLU45773.1 hypothetical protein Nans01_01240 [Nocardiopsis ansamitocini]
MDDRWTPEGDGAADFPAAAPAGPGFPPPPDTHDSDEPKPAPEPERRSRKGLVIGIVAGVTVLALAGAGVSWYVLSMPKPEETVTGYASAWNSGDYPALAELATGEGVAEAYTAVAENLGVESTSVTTGTVTSDGDTASVPYTVALTLANAGDWSYEGELPLERVDGEWKVAFSPSVIHPQLGQGQTLTRVNQWGDRGQVLAADGSRVDTPENAGSSVGMIVGEVGTASAEDLEDLGPAYAEGDPTGASGIQKSQEARLAGTPTTSIQIVDEGEDAEPDEDAPVVGSIEGTPGQDVTLSIDPAIQSAAGAAISGQGKPTALVAVRPSTGEVLAAVNAPGGFNRAFEGQYPAGSTFKIISYDALLGAGLGTGDTMDCPKVAEVGGWPFKNAGDAEYGDQSVTEAFATSCNTALVQEVAERLDGASLVDAAERFGFNSDLDVGVPTLESSFPTPDSTTLLAAMSIGQGQMLTSPLHMATVPAAVADGSWRSPVLVTDPALPDQPEPTPVPNAEALRPMMRAVVTEGTAKDVGFTGDVHGKSGTAEYGTAEEGEDLPAHGWFVGYEDDVAFAVIVEDGESGSGAAAPLAKKFLDGL